MTFKLNTTIGFMGVGNMAQAIIKGLVDSKSMSADKIFVSNRSEGKLNKVRDLYGVQVVASNEELIEKSNVVVLSMKPQDLIAALDPLTGLFHNKQIVMSLAAGITLGTLKKYLKDCRCLRLMPNTPTLIGHGLTGFYTDSTDDYLSTLVEDIFQPLGQVIKLSSEDEFASFMIACSSGIGFVFEFMSYWQDWLIEHGFEDDMAKNLTIHTFLGASRLADANSHQSLADLIGKVASKKGVTEAGLNSMHELELERGLRIAFEKAAMRNQEMSKLLK